MSFAKHVPAIEIELIRAVSRSCSAITDRPAALTVRQVRTSQASTSKTWSRVDPIERIKGRSWLYRIENFSRVLLTSADWFGTAVATLFGIGYIALKRVTWNLLATEQKETGAHESDVTCQ